jgi:hypothetical protein
MDSFFFAPMGMDFIRIITGQILEEANKYTAYQWRVGGGGRIKGRFLHVNYCIQTPYLISYFSKAKMCRHVCI